MYCDLHTHSVFSDGTYTPAQIVAEAKALGLAAVALTDHNTMDGIPEFMEAAAAQGVEAVAGVELSTDHDGTEYHLLGLYLAPEHYPAITRLMKEYQVLKEINNVDTLERLNEAGYQVSYNELRKIYPNGNINRAHIATVMMEKGYVATVSQAFETVLREGGGIYVPPERLKLMEAIDFFKRLGVVSVLAHPLQDTDEATLRGFLPQAVERGLVGIEVLHSSYSPEQRQLAALLAREYGLKPCGGSDFHGQTKPNIRLGSGKGDLCVPLAFHHGLRP